MYKQLIPAIITGSLLITPAFAFNPIMQTPAQKFLKTKVEQRKSLQSKKSHFTDFSGIWEGSCNDDGDIVNVHNFAIDNDETFLVLGGTVYVIGDNYGQTQSNEYFHLQQNTRILWNADRTALEMHHIMLGSETDAFDKPVMNLIGKSTLSFKNNEELVFTSTSNGYNTNGDTADKKDGDEYDYLGLHTMTCVLKKQQQAVG